MSATTVALSRGNLAIDVRRSAPTLVAALLAGAYVIVRPPSADLAAQLLRAELFHREGFGLWSNWWYGGHSTLGYSVLFPALGAWLTPQLAAALAATATAVLFSGLADRHFGPDAWLGATLFAAATAINLYTGRLTLAAGALPAMGSVVALDCGVASLAAGLAVITALLSPVAALFAALAGGAYALRAFLRSRQVRAGLPGVAVVAGALLPVVAVAVAFPTPGYEPFALSTLWPVLLICAGLLVALRRDGGTLPVAVALYAGGLILAYLVPSPVGSNAARLGTFLAAPLATLLWWPQRRRLLVALIVPLLYLGFYPPARDLIQASADAATSPGYYTPLLRFLATRGGPPFRVEIPFTAMHWEAYAVAPRFALARGWERQLDIAENPLFYSGALDAARYAAWLHANAVRFVAVADAPLDYSARSEVALIGRGLPYLHEVMRSAHWRVYAVSGATPIVTGPARLRSLGPQSIALSVRAPGSVYVRVRFNPYWALTRGAGCVAPAGAYTRVTAIRAGPVQLDMRFALGRLESTAATCSRG